MASVPTYPPDTPGIDVTADQILVRDRIVRDGHVVTVVGRHRTDSGDLLIKWESAERAADGLPLMYGVTHVWVGRAEEIRLVDRPRPLGRLFGRVGGGR